MGFYADFAANNTPIRQVKDAMLISLLQYRLELSSHLLMWNGAWIIVVAWKGCLVVYPS